MIHVPLRSLALAPLRSSHCGLAVALGLAFLLALAPRAAAASGDDPVLESLWNARARAVVANSEGRVGDSVDALSDALRRACEELATRPYDDRSTELADAVEYALVTLLSQLSVTGNRAYLTERLDGVSIDPVHGPSHALLAWIREREVDELAPLYRFEFAGPFDNERGAGLDRLPPAATEPDAISYPGKLRDVVWRTTPSMPPRFGEVRFGYLIDPWNQACVVARTWVHSDVEREALLYLGATSEARAWVDGEQVVALLGERTLRTDAVAVPIELDAGWNEIAILVGGEDGAPAFVARLAERGTARPLQLEHVAERPEGAPIHVLAARAPRSTDPLDAPGARRRALADDSANGWLRRSRLADFFRPTPEAEHPGRTEAERAFELDPESIEVRTRRAEALVPTGSAAERDINPWLRAVDDVLASDTDQPWALRQKARHSIVNQPMLLRALEELERALARNPEDMQSLGLRVSILDSLGRSAEADLDRRRMLDLPRAALWPTYRVGATAVLSSADPRGTQILQDAYASTSDPSYVSALAWSSDLLDRNGESGADRVVRLARLTAENDPWNGAPLVRAAYDLIGLGENDRALALVDEALALAPERAATHRWRARALLADGDIENAVAALERLLELDFSAEDDRRLLDHLRASGVQPFHAPYLEPLADVIARTTLREPSEPAPGTTGGGDGASREVLLSRVVVDVQPDGTAQRYYRQVVRILTERGARDLDRVPFGAYGNQEVRVLTANVLGEDGEERGARTGRSSYGIVVDLPPLSIGDVIDLEWRVDDLRPTFFGQYFGFRSGFAPDPSVPTRESEIVLRTTPELPLRTHARGGVGEPQVVALENGGEELTWRLDDLAPVRSEPLMPPATELLPTVQASSYASWEAFGTWWWDLIEEEIKVSPQMRDKVRELTADATTQADRLRAIYDFVVTDIRYNAWEFGVHGYLPYSAPVIYSRGFGDCKDKAILLRALLSEVGIEAWPVLIDAQDRRQVEDHELALVEHFNHCIAFVPEQEGLPEMFLDGTARHHPLGVLPQMDAGARVLVVKEGGVEERTVPFGEADANSWRLDVDAEFFADGGATVGLRRTSFGREGATDRARFDGSADEREETAKQLLARLFGPIAGGVQISTSDLEDLATPVSISMMVSAEQLARPTADGFEIPISLDRLGLLRTAATVGANERRTDLLLTAPSSRTIRVVHTLPQNLAPAEAPESVELRCEDATYTLTISVHATGWIVEESFALLSNRIPVERYAAFREFAARVDEAQSAVLVARTTQ
jgi:cellulose synthase operon protein C